MFKIYIHPTTGELITDDGKDYTGYPGLSELFRTKNAERGAVSIISMHDNSSLPNLRTLRDLQFSQCFTEAGVAYASLDAFWTALDDYFTV